MRKYTNNASSTLASGIIAVDGQCTIDSGEAANFPAPTGGDYALCTIEDVSGNLEIVRMTARAGGLCTITRAQEGTTAQDFASGSRFELRVTAASLNGFLQKDGDSITGTIEMTGAGRLEGGGLHDAEVVNTPIRGDTGVTANQFLVPPGGGAPTIGGQAVWHAGNLTRAAAAAILFPTGVIMMWYGAVPDIPAGWTLCDGSGATPDLRDKFIVGAGTTYTMGDTGGSVSKDTDEVVVTLLPTTLTLAMLPSHTHFMFIDLDGTGAVTNANQVFKTSTSGGDSEYSLDGGANAATVGRTATAGSASPDGHTHTASLHKHTIADALPPYTALYFIMKT